jgi:nitronate monooxygenase
VSDAGALGALGLGATDPAAAAAQVAAARARTDQPLHLNFFCHGPAARDAQAEAAWIAHFREDFALLGAPPPERLEEIYAPFDAQEGMLELIDRFRPEVVSFHFGVPRSAHLQAVAARGAFTLASVTSAEEGQAALAAGIDGLVAQGFEAGGHRSVFEPQAPDRRLATADLLDELLAVTDAPVVAAGGAMDGTDIRRLLDAGAAAVQLGTAFVLCPESAASADYRQALSASTGSDTVMTRVISGRAARGVHNALTKRGEEPMAPAAPAYPVAYDLAKHLQRAAAARQVAGYGAYWAGTGVARARSLPAAELIHALAAEAGL